MAKAIKKAKTAFNHMIKPPKAAGPVTHKKGNTKKGPQGPYGAKAPNMTHGKGKKRK